MDDLCLVRWHQVRLPAVVAVRVFLVPPRLDGGLHHLQVFLGTDPEALWEPEWRHSVAIRCHHAKHHGGHRVPGLTDGWDILN